MPKISDIIKLHCWGGGVKPSSNSGFGVIKSFVCDVIPHSLRNLKNIKRCRNKYGMTICRLATLPNKTYIASYRMNEVNCGIFQDITKRFRNAFHLCGMTSVKKLVAFTLAETLIVMGIIGIVSALTLPNLNSSTGEKEKIAKVKKIYQNLEDTLGRAQAVYGPIEEWFLKDNNDTAYNQRLAERMMEFMKVSKNCGTSGSGCFSSSKAKTLSGADGTSLMGTRPMALLADGTAVGFQIVSENCSATKDDSKQSDICGLIYVDIDGPKGANTWGKDIFGFFVSKSAISPNGLGLTGNFNVDDTQHSAWIIQNDNMDYLKTTSGKCSNGKVLDWTTNTTCK